MTTKPTEKTLEEQIRENQRKITTLTQSMGLWINTPFAQKPEVRAKIAELQDRTLLRLRQLEIEGQQAKIAGAEAVISLLKTGA